MARCCGRGSFPVQDVASARQLTIVCGVAMPNQPVAWPDVHQLMRNPILRAHNLVHLANPQAEEDQESMAPTRQMSQSDLLLAAQALAGGQPSPVQHDEADVRLRAADFAQLNVTQDGVLWLDAVDLEPDSDSSPDVDGICSKRCSCRRRQGHAMRAQLGLAAPNEAQMLRPSDSVFGEIQDETTADAPASEEQPVLEE